LHEGLVVSGVDPFDRFFSPEFDGLLRLRYSDWLNMATYFIKMIFLAYFLRI
jgi:hypothetical protein